MMTCAPPRFLQLLGRVRCLAVDVDVRSEFLGEGGVFRATPDGRYLVPKLIRVLNSEMTQAADALHSDKIARKRSAVAQCIVGSNSSAEQWRRFGVL